MKCVLKHPIAAFRYGRAEKGISIDGIYFRGSLDVIFKSPLSEAEQRFIRAVFVPWGIFISPDLYKESVQRAMEALATVV